MRLVCFVNGIFSDQIGGGDVYFSHIAKAAAEKYPIHFIGGHATKKYLERQGFPMNLTLTDSGAANLGDVTCLKGQLKLLLDFSRRFFSTLPKLGFIQREDVAYSMSDFWFDVFPMVLCRARAKILYLGMIAPSFGEIVRRTRPDIPPSRLASIYYWASQQLSLRLLRFCKGRHVTYSHPEMKVYLQQFGYKESELTYVANGMDVRMADQTPEQAKEYDVVWTGRVHAQKGIEDLLISFEHLCRHTKDFKGLVIGRSKDLLEPKIRAMGLENHITFAGLVSEEEKFRLLKASRVFAMPSHYESWGIVVGEALASGVPVVAYDVPCYRPVFGDYVKYVKSFDVDAFKTALETEVLRQRAGQNFLAGMDLAKLKRELSWDSARHSFTGLLEKIDGTAG
jgi:glycosyltransferase involved in cell wall biosynthesis